jgi:hypothetical protein
VAANGEGIEVYSVVESTAYAALPFERVAESSGEMEGGLSSDDLERR